MSIRLISLNKEWVDQMKAHFKDIPTVKVQEGNINEVAIDNSCFVSPANCLGFMDGGIDWVLSRELLPGIEPKVKERIKELGILSSLGRPYLPIGSAIAVQYSARTFLIVAPTMFLPHDVRGTQNAYWSFFAALKMWQKVCRQTNTQFTLVVTSHCCGCGKMSGKESAEQMKRAYDDFIGEKGPEMVNEYDNCLLFPNRDMEQPNNFDNMEIKTLQMSKEEYLTKMFQYKKGDIS